VLARVVIDLVAGTCVEEATLLVNNCGTSTAHSAGAINFASNDDMVIFSGEHSSVSGTSVPCPLRLFGIKC
jgi:hypothetical protein